MAENMTIDSLKHGKVNIADDVIGVIASIAASEIGGIKGLSGTISEEVMEMMGKKNYHKGVQVEMMGNLATINLSVVMDYGTKIDETAVLVQENVKTAIESMTGVSVNAVNITVEGITTKKEV
ncbi:Asp23/Gls24 family envelope stress response protein [Fusibacter tunisiensis]|uniref:Alkaline shock family protein YloU n=1 Tax=Fusibacter tunisiensis TaxID=1008308 RepID=A0ABS2MQ98_9FIRM|nr:Asp23/Gls24 family envelope stress response protein [Fusibacter tunisiensis]MBM7561569.1 putative alkaline shock family protein YloU [Fusibacter tunisiensis]